MSNIIKDTKTALENMTAEQKEAIETIKLFTDLVSNCQSVKDLNDVLDKNKNMDKKAIKIQIWQLLQLKAEDLNCKFDDKKLVFIEVKKEQATKPENELKETALEPVNQETTEFIKPF